MITAKTRLLCLLLILLCIPGFSSCKKEKEPEVLELLCAVGAPLPSAEDFFLGLPEGTTVRFEKDYAFTSVGSYEIVLICTSKEGKETAYTTQIELVYDHSAPVITGALDISVCLGDGISYRSGVTVIDDTDPEPTLEIDSSSVDHTKPGKYPVIYTATDWTGKRTTAEIFVYIYEERITKEQLMEKLSLKLSKHITPSMTTRQKAEAVYHFVYTSIAFENSSDKGDWIRAAYYGLETGYGDCFTYFALSKACFEYLDIANIDVQRKEGLVPERHYWNLVNIGTEQNARWYHFDACHLLDKPYPWGCLMTEAQLDSYSKDRYFADTDICDYFYNYDAEGKPAISTEIITPVS